MNHKIVNSLLFFAGIAIGSLTTWQYVVKKYERIAQEEIDSVKAVFSKKSEHVDFESQSQIAKAAAEDAKAKPDITEYAAIIREHGYVNYSNAETRKNEEHCKKDKEDESVMTDKPHVISPDDFAEFDDYEKIGLTYYADQTLADDNDDVVEDVDDIVGFDALSSFGEYEDDSVFVRNDKLKCDYEILLDHRKYSDVIKGMPHEVDD